MRPLIPALTALCLTVGPVVPLQAADWPDLSRLSIHLDNDEFTGNRPDDRWYSSGGRIDWHSPPNPLAGLNPVTCLQPLRSLRQPSRQRFVSLGQDIYSQNTRTNTVPNPDDRPMGALLYLQAGQSVLSPVVDGTSAQATAKIELGVTGPAALGESIQNGIHHMLGVREVTIWNYQVRPRLGLNLHLSCLRQSSSTATDQRAPMVLHYGYDMSVGNVLTQAGVSLAVSAGPSARAMTVPRSARLASPVVRKVRRWGLIAGLSARAVAYDALLDGDTYGYRSRVSSKPLQGEAFIGVTLALGSRWQLSYALSRRTIDFEGPGVSAKNYKRQNVGQLVLQAPL